MTTFDMLGLSPRLMEKFLTGGISEPTPIQARAIPEVLNGRDLMGLAQTGTGKTAAFGLPILHMLAKAGTKPAPKTARALILAPTRELVKQIADSLSPMTQGTHMKVTLVVGGMSLNVQARKMERGTDLLVATPGRLLDLINRGAIRLDETQFLVLDEADQMLDMGFVHDLRKIAALLPEERQTLLFSATMPKLMNEIAETYLTAPVRIQVAPPGKAADKITQSVHYVVKAEKNGLLVELLDKHRDELALVFARTKHGAERLMKHLVGKGFAAGSIHGNKSQGQRDRALKAFRDGELKILVATDVAARGIDIPDVRFVYNYDLPNVPDNYVHRIGRTARAGASGQAVAFCAPDEFDQLKAIHKTMKIEIPTASGRPWADMAPQKADKGGRGRGAGNGPGNSSGKPRHRRRRSGGGGRRKAA